MKDFWFKHGAVILIIAFLIVAFLLDYLIYTSDLPEWVKFGLLFGGRR